MSYLSDARFDDHKVRLEVWCRMNGRREPRYLTKRQMKGRGVVYISRVYSGTKLLGEGQGDRPDYAEKDAARNVLNSLGVLDDEDIKMVVNPRGNTKKKGKKKKHSKSVRESIQRRAPRKALLGREFEKVVASYLEELQAVGEIDSYSATTPNSEEDRAGKDFIVRRGEEEEVFFGVTTSHKSWKVAKLRYRDVPQFHFPHNTKPDTVKRRILELFSS